MSILIGLLTSVISFLVNLSVKSSINLVKADLKRREKSKKKKKSKKASSSTNKSKKPADKIRNKFNKNKIKKDDSDSEKAKKVALKLLESLKRQLTIIKLFFRTLRIAITLLLSFITTLVFTGAFAILSSFVLLLCVVNVASSGSNYNVYTSTRGTTTSDNNSYVSTPIEADVKEIIDMTETEVWMLASEGRFKSYSEANNAAQKDMEGEKEFWTNLLVSVEVPAWKWADDSKTSKVDSTVKIRINKYFAEYWTAFMTDLHAQPDKYVIEEIGGFNFRAKNNGTGTTALSAHSFGLVLDINYQSKGMGSNAAGQGDGTPWNSDQGLSEPYRSESCAFTGNWFNLVKKYRLDWGGLWTARSLDPMHFSIVGDRNRDTRNYQPNTSGQNPK